MKSDSEIVEHIIALILQGKNGARANSSNESHFFLVRAAMKQGFREPFTQEQCAMNKILSDQRIGREDCDSVWKMYGELKSDREII